MVQRALVLMTRTKFSLAMNQLSSGTKTQSLDACRLLAHNMYIIARSEGDNLGAISSRGTSCLYIYIYIILYIYIYNNLNKDAQLCPLIDQAMFITRTSLRANLHTLICRSGIHSALPILSTLQVKQVRLLKLVNPKKTFDMMTR